MESKKIHGLFFAGEVIDVDAESGEVIGEQQSMFEEG